MINLRSLMLSLSQISSSDDSLFDFNAWDVENEESEAHDQLFEETLSKVYTHPLPLKRMKAQQQEQREKLQDLRQLGELAREGASKGAIKKRLGTLEMTYREILDKNPKHLPTLNEYALLLSVGRADHDAAEELYLSALGINPFHKGTLSDYGFFLERIRGDFDGAEEMYIRALKMDPKHIVSRSLLSYIIYKA